MATPTGQVARGRLHRCTLNITDPLSAMFHSQCSRRQCTHPNLRLCLTTHTPTNRHLSLIKHNNHRHRRLITPRLRHKALVHRPLSRFSRQHGRPRLHLHFPQSRSATRCRLYPTLWNPPPRRLPLRRTPTATSRALARAMHRQRNHTSAHTAQPSPRHITMWPRRPELVQTPTHTLSALAIHSWMLTTTLPTLVT